jgi:hypothetical protein
MSCELLLWMEMVLILFRQISSGVLALVCSGTIARRTYGMPAWFHFGEAFGIGMALATGNITRSLDCAIFRNM